MDAKTLKDRLLDPTVLAAIVGAFLGGVFVLLAVWHQGRRSDAILEIVDLSPSESADPIRLDIKVRNTGDAIAVIKRVELHVDKAWVLQALHAPLGHLETTMDYDVVLPVDSPPPYVMSKVVSQTIEPGKADRFSLAIARSRLMGPSLNRGLFVYFFSLTLVYNERSQAVSSGPLLYALARPGILDSELPGGQINLRFAPQALPDVIAELRGEGAVQERQKKLTLELVSSPGERNSLAAAVVRFLSAAKLEPTHPLF